jgi:hypothetical protein
MQHKLFTCNPKTIKDHDNVGAEVLRSFNVRVYICIYTYIHVHISQWFSQLSPIQGILSKPSKMISRTRILSEIFYGL